MMEGYVELRRITSDIRSNHVVALEIYLNDDGRDPGVCENSKGHQDNAELTGRLLGVIIGVM